VRRLIRGFGRFWWDFIVGDDWRIAAGVVAVAAVGATLVASDALPDWAVAVLATAGVALVALGSVVLAAKRAN
jgi:hypothetical protein